MNPASEVGTHERESDTTLAYEVVRHEHANKWIMEKLVEHQSHQGHGTIFHDACEICIYAAVIVLQKGSKIASMKPEAKQYLARLDVSTINGAINQMNNSILADSTYKPRLLVGAVVG